LEIAGHLQTLELELLTNTTRKNAQRVSALLADNFREFGSSGRVYTKENIIVELQQEKQVSIEAMDFNVMLLAKEIALVTYRSLKEQQNAPPRIALRSSIWIKEGDDWRMVFHQGTKLS
jgi:hypothetical protein